MSLSMSVFLIVYTFNGKKFYIINKKTSHLPTTVDIGNVNKLLGIKSTDYILLGNEKCTKNMATGGLVCFFLYEDDELYNNFSLESLKSDLTETDYELHKLERKDIEYIETSSALYWYDQYRGFDVLYVYDKWKGSLSSETSKYLQKLLQSSPEKYIELLYMFYMIMNLPSSGQKNKISNMDSKMLELFKVFKTLN